MKRQVTKGMSHGTYRRLCPLLVTRDAVKQTPGEDARRSITVTVAL